MLPWIRAGLAVLLVAALLYWELVLCEGVHLGARAVIWLYDWFAPRYDATKRFDEEFETAYLAEPLLAALQAAGPAPFVLDVATGTGRLPAVLLRQPAFNGRIVGLDLARAMLAHAARKLAPDHARGRVALVWHAAVPLPFPAETFDAVACLEALEFMPDLRGPLRECARVLRPGGLLLVTRRRSRELIGHVPGPARFAGLLAAAGFVEIETRPWQVDYDQVWARKPGVAARHGVRPLAEVLVCPRCGATGFAVEAEAWRCAACGARVPIGADGVVEVL